MQLIIGWALKNRQVTRFAVPETSEQRDWYRKVHSYDKKSQQGADRFTSYRRGTPKVSRYPKTHLSTLLRKAFGRVYAYTDAFYRFRAGRSRRIEPCWELTIDVVTQRDRDHGTLPDEEQDLAVGGEGGDVVQDEQTAANMLLAEADPAALRVEPEARRQTLEGGRR